VEDVEAGLAAQGRWLVVVEEAEVTGDLVRDLVDVRTSCCARLDGRRAARRAQAALQAALGAARATGADA